MKTDDDPMVHVVGLRSHLYSVNVKAIFAKTTSDSDENDKDDNNDNNKQQQQEQFHQQQYKQLELLERMKMVDMLHDFVANYRNLLICASTPIPFPLIQMGRTFLFLWTFSIPLVLRGVVSEIYTGMAFVFFLTYGFVGLELVAMKLMFPFGDDYNDLNVIGMKEVNLKKLFCSQRIVFVVCGF